MLYRGNLDNFLDRVPPAPPPPHEAVFTGTMCSPGHVFCVYFLLMGWFPFLTRHHRIRINTEARAKFRRKWLGDPRSHAALVILVWMGRIVYKAEMVQLKYTQTYKCVLLTQPAFINLSATQSYRNRRSERPSPKKQRRQFALPSVFILILCQTFYSVHNNPAAPYIGSLWQMEDSKTGFKHEWVPSDEETYTERLQNSEKANAWYTRTFIEEGCIQKRKQRSSLMLGGNNCLNSLPH